MIRHERKLFKEILKLIIMSQFWVQPMRDQHYNVISSLIGWARIQNDPWICRSWYNVEHPSPTTPKHGWYNGFNNMLNVWGYSSLRLQIECRPVITWCFSFKTLIMIKPHGLPMRARHLKRNLQSTITNTMISLGMSSANETMLYCNICSHWLSPYSEWSLQTVI